MHKELKYLLLTNSFFLFANNLFAPLFALFIQKIDSAVFHVGGIWSTYIFGVGILTFILSRYENHIEYADYFLIAVFFFRMIGWIAYYFSTQLWHLYLIQIIMAIGEALGSPSYNVIYSRFLTKGKYGSDWGLNTSITSFVIGFASLFGGLIVQYFGFDILFIIMIVSSIISIIIGFYYCKILDK